MRKRPTVSDGALKAVLLLRLGMRFVGMLCMIVVLIVIFGVVFGVVGASGSGDHRILPIAIALVGVEDLTGFLSQFVLHVRIVLTRIAAGDNASGIAAGGVI